MFEILKTSKRLFGNAKETSKATTAMEKKSDDLYATYLSIDDDDDFDDEPER